MPSKGRFTDLLNQVKWSSLGGVQCFLAHDPLVFQFIKRKLQQDRELKVVFAEELSISWLEEKFIELSLFSSNESFFVYNAHLLSGDTLAFIEEKVSPELVERALFLNFLGKASIKAKLQKRSFSVTEFEDVKFWEYEKVIMFLASYFSMKIPSRAHSIILDQIENDLNSLYSFISQLSLYSREPSLEQIQSLIQKDRIDLFELASHLSKKNLSQFYKELTFLIENRFDELIGALSFLQGHLFKILDPSYMQKKKKLSQYDQQIQVASKQWTQAELFEKIKEFSEFLVLAKEKNNNLSSRVHGLSLTSS